MKIITKKSKRWKNFTASFTWIGTNLFIQINYDVNSKWGLTATIQDGKITSKFHNSLGLWLTQHTDHVGDDSDLHVAHLVPTTTKERQLFRECHAFIMQCDYCDTQIMIVPSITQKHWDKLEHIKAS